MNKTDTEKIERIFKMAQEEVNTLYTDAYKDLIIMGEMNATKLHEDISAVYDKYSIIVEREGKIDKKQ